MDKFFIQNAFKTLDEIEEEMNKQKSLNESLNETKAKPEGDKISSYNDGLKLAKVYNKPVIYGYSNNRLQGKFFKLDDPIVCDDVVKCERDFRNQYKNCSVVYVAYPDKEFVEQESLNEDLTLDLDELADKYVGLTCNINNEESDYNNEIGTIKSLVDYEGDFSNSVWEIVLNTGVSLNVLGDDLEVNLQEKLPKDLATAYSNAPAIFRKSVNKDTDRELHYPSEFFPKSMQRRGVTIDFENSNYKEISKEEALKYSKAPLRSKLRVLFNRYGKYMVMMWDENNTPITRPQEFEYAMDYGESPYTFKNIIKHADKIYVTDEDEHKIVRDRSTNQDDDYLKFLDYTKGIGNWSSNASPMEIKAYNDKQSGYNNRSNDIDDTGNHKTGYRYAYDSYRYRTLLRRQEEYEDKLKELSGKTLTTTETEYLNSLRRLLKDSQINYLKSLNNMRQAMEPNRLKPLMNTTLADLIILKYALKKEQKNFQKAENNDTADLRYHKYVELTEELKRLEDKLKAIQARIDEVNSELTPELKQEYEELQEEKLFSIGDKFQEILNELNKLRKDRGLKVDESLKEELDCETHLRIYTQNESGYEDFIDGPTPNSEWSSEEEALTKAKELAQDDDYEHVCLVKIKYCPEINDEEVTILFDSYELEESLNEEKINIDYVVSLFGDDSHYYKEEEDHDDIPLSPDISGATKFNKKKDISILDIVKDVCEYSLKYMPEDEAASLFDLDTVEEVYEKDEDYFISSGLVKIITVYKNKKINLPESLNEDTNKDTRSIGEIVDDILGTKNESLNESKSFNLKDESDIIDATAYKEVGKETPEQLVVVDPSLESKDDDLQPHAGDAILQCRECKTIIFQRTEDLVQDGDTDIYNKDMPCPHCGAHSGFNYLYQAADKNSVVTDKEEEIIETPEPTENEEDASLPPVESDFISLDDIDNIQEESFERLVNPYLVKLYENIKEFKTTNVTQEGPNGFKITGKLIGNTGKEKLVEFLFTIKENNATSIVLEGYNKLLTEDLKAYNFKAKIENKELIFESFSYKYNKNIDGKDTLIEGIEE